MGLLDDVFDFFFGWLIPDTPKPEFPGQEVTIQKPTNAQIVYGQVFNQKGVIVRSELVESPTTDIPNELMYVQIVWSAGAIESIDNLYLNETLDSDPKWQNDDGGSFVWAYHVPSGGSVDIVENGSDPVTNLTFDGKGNAYSIVRLQIAPEKMPTFPNMTADLKGRLIENLATGQVEFSDNYADIIYDYLVQPYGRGIKESRLDKPSFVTERAFTETLVNSYSGSSTQQKLMSCNVVLDGNKKVLDNLNILRKGCRGFLPYVDGNFRLIVERERDPVAFEITDDNKMGDLVLEDSNINEHYNKVTVKYYDKEQQGKEASVIFPDDNTSYVTADNGVPLETTVTLDTINNEYEAKQAAEIIFNRSRDTLKAKYRTKSEGRVVNVGDVLNISNEAFGMVQKPFIVNNKKVRASGIVEFELIEYQATIYPWSDKTQQIIPDTVIPDYTTVTTATNLTVDYDYNEVSQAQVTWESNHNSFIVSIEDDQGNITNLGTTANKYINLDGFEIGSYTLKIKSVNGLGYVGSGVTIPVTITAPTTPALSADPVGNFLYARPVSLDVPYEYYFEFYYGTVDTGDVPDTNILTRAPDGTFMDIVEGITKNTTYYVYHKLKTRLADGNWVKNVLVSGQGIQYDQLSSGVTNIFNDFNVDLTNTRATLETQIGEGLIVALQDIQNRTERDFLTADYVNEIDGFRIEINDLLGQVIVEGGQVSADTFIAYQLKVDTNEAQLSSIATWQTQTDTTLTTQTSQISQNTADITFLVENTNIGDVAAQFNSVNLRIDGTDNAIEQQALSVNITNFNLLNSILDGTLRTHDTLDQGLVLALAETNIQAITTETSALAQTDTEILAVANNALSAANLNTTALSDETAARLSQEAIFTARFDDNESNISTNTTAISDETSARATADTLLQANIDNETTTRNAEIASVNSAITNESTARASVDITLQASIDATDSSLLTTITRVDAVETDVSDNQSAISVLEADVNSPSTGLSAAYTLAQSANVTGGDNANAITILQNSVNDPATGLSATNTLAQTAVTSSGDNAGAITLLASSVNDPTTGLSATNTLAQNASTSAGDNASAITTLQSGVTTADTTANSALTLATTVDERTDTLATFALETDVNGFTSGIYNQNDGTTADFRIRTNNFSIIDATDDSIILDRNSETDTWEFAGNLKAAGGDFTGRLLTPEINTLTDGSGDTTKAWSVLSDGSIIIRYNHPTDSNLDTRFILGPTAGANGDFMAWFGGKLPQASRTTANATFALLNDGSAKFGGTLEGADGTFAGTLSAAIGTFSGDLSAAGGTFEGDLSAAGGTFEGDVVIGEFLISTDGYLRTNAPESANSRLVIYGGDYSGSDDYSLWVGQGSSTDNNGKLYIKRSTGDLVVKGRIEAGEGFFQGDITGASGVFSGDLSAATVTGSTISGGTISGTTITGTNITGGTFTGNTFNGATGDFSGDITATTGYISNWIITSDSLRSASSGARIELDSAKNRISIFDLYGEKVVMGYLDGLTKNDGSGNWGANDYGFWALPGESLVIDGDTTYKAGNWIVENDASVKIHNGAGNEIIRLGSHSGNKGVFLYDGDGTGDTDLLGEFSTRQIKLGKAGNNLTYDPVSGALSVTGAITATSGTFSGEVNASSGSFTGDVSIDGSGALKILDGSNNETLRIGLGPDDDSLDRGITYFDGNGTNESDILFRLSEDRIHFGKWFTGADYITYNNDTGTLTISGGVFTGELFDCIGTFNGDLYQVGGSFTGDCTGTMTGGSVDGSEWSHRHSTKRFQLTETDSAFVWAGDDSITKANQSASNGDFVIGSSGTTYIKTLNVTGTLTETSDERVKENVVTMTGGLDRINQLRPVCYNRIGNDRVECGLIAQETKQVQANVVNTDEDSGLLSVAYTRLVPDLISAIQELTEQNKSLIARIEQLEAEQ